MKRQPVPRSLFDRIVKKVCLLWDLLFVSNLGVAYFFGGFPQKSFLSHFTNTSQRLQRKSPAGVVKNSSGYSWQICLIFAVEDLGCLRSLHEDFLSCSLESKECLKVL